MTALPSSSIRRRLMPLGVRRWVNLAGASLAVALLLASGGCATSAPKLVFDPSVPMDEQKQIQTTLDTLYDGDTPAPQDIEKALRLLAKDKQAARDAIVPFLLYVDENYDFTSDKTPGVREDSFANLFLQMGPVESPAQLEELKSIFKADSLFTLPQPGTRRIALRLLVQAKQMTPENLITYFGTVDDGFLKQEIIDMYVYQTKDNPTAYEPALDKVIADNKSPSAVYDALMVYGKIDGLKALYIALKLFDSKDDIIYRASFTILANSAKYVSQIDEKTLHQLLDKLIEGLNRGSDPKTIAMATQALEKTGILTQANVHSLIPYIQKQLPGLTATNQPDDIISLVHLLGLAGPTAKESVSLLFTIADDKDKKFHYYLRLQAVHSLGEVLQGSRDADAIARLQAYLPGDDTQQMQNAIKDAIAKIQGLPPA